jgi:hypothetical protein
MRKALCSMLLVCAVIPGAALAARAPQRLEEPPPVPVPSELTQDQARRAIHAAVDKYGWVIDEESPGHSRATLLLREHMVQVDIAYETRLITINYLDSQHMGFEVNRNVRYIHPKYKKWTRNLATEIGVQLAAARKPSAAKPASAR